jgi:hypothetical protein
MQEVTIFVDESGDPNLNTELSGTTIFYNITGIIVANNDLVDFERLHSELFGEHESKSSAIRNSERRLRRISKLSDLKFNYTALTVDKRKVWKDSGLSHKRSYIKYFHKRLFDRFNRLYGSVRIIADECGSNVFMAQCKKHYELKYQPPMSPYISLPFDNRFTFESANSRSWRGLQVADLIAGTLRRVYEKQEDESILKVIESKKRCVEIWPRTRDVFIANQLPENIDEQIQETAINSVFYFLGNSSNSDDENIQMQVEVLDYLLGEFSRDQNRYISSDELIEYLKTFQGYRDISQHKFMFIVGGLRSEGVAIVSGPSGYKIPNSHADVECYITKVLGTVDPYVTRLGKFRDLFFEASNGTYDIFDSDKLKSIRQYLTR